MVLASENQHEGTNVPSIKSPVVDEEKMRPGHYSSVVVLFFLFYMDEE